MNETAIRQAAVQMMKLHGTEAELASARQADPRPSGRSGRLAAI